MKYCLHESQGTNDMSKKRKRKATMSTEQAEVRRLVKDVVADVASFKEVAEKPAGVTDTNVHCNDNTLNAGSNSYQSSLGMGFANVESNACNLNFQTCFDKAPIFATSNQSEKCDEDMESCNKSPGMCNMDETVLLPSTSGNLDDSVIICETKENSRKTRPRNEAWNDSVIEVGEVLVISDTEDEHSMLKIGRNGISDSGCNSSFNRPLKCSPTKTMDIICVSSPDLFHVSPPRSVNRPRKRQKRSAIDTVPRLTRVVNVSSTKECSFLGSKSQPDLKIVSEVKNVLPLSQTFSRLDCKAKSRGTCQQDLCSVHRKFSRKIILQRKARGRKFRGKRVRGGSNVLPRTVSTNAGFVFAEPDLCITSEKLVKVASGNLHDAVASCSLRPSVDISLSHLQNKENTAILTKNIIFSTQVQPRKRTLRPVVVDGSNVAYTHGQRNRPKTYSCRGIELCVKYFHDRGHEVTVFVPQYRRCRSKEVVDQGILERLGEQQVVVFTPSRKVDGVLINSYDDRFILDLAARTGGVIVSNDNYRDLKNEKPEWREAVNERLLMYLFVGDHFMVPDDPLGSRGVSLDRFLSFPS